MINETRFGSVTALQEEIVRLQEQVKQLQESRGVYSVHSNQSLTHELSLSHQMCCDMYYRNADLWRELYTLQKAYSRLQREVKVVLDSLERKNQEGSDGANEYVSSLIHIATHLVNKNSYSTIVCVACLLHE